MSMTVHTDGGSRSNPGPAGIGVIARDGDEVVFTLSEFLGEQTNNFAEYTAVIRALEELATRNHTDDIAFFLDSKLVVEQVQGNWKVKEPTLKPLVARVHELLEDFGRVTFTHVRREENAHADALANEAMDNA